MPTFQFGFADLDAALGGKMGEPIECEHTDPLTGATTQRTSTGVASYAKDTNALSFIAGDQHWSLTDKGLQSWTGEAGAVVAPTAVVAVVPTPIPTQAPAATPTTPTRPDPQDVEITLQPTRDALAAGDLWAVIGTIFNRSKDHPIWIVDKKTALMFAPEVYGTKTGTFTLIADYPTVFYDPDVRYKATSLRIDPGSSYAVIWRFNSPSNPSKFQPCKSPASATAAAEDATFAMVPVVPTPTPIEQTSIYDGSVPSIVSNYGYFYPGAFRATATVHIWYAEPQVDDANCVVYLANSFPITSSKDMTINAPQWVLILGAFIGGVVSRGCARGAGLPTNATRMRFSIVSVGLMAG